MAKFEIEITEKKEPGCLSYIVAAIVILIIIAAMGK